MLEMFMELLSRLFFFTGSLTKEGGFPEPLEPEEEARCISLAAAGDAEARGRLIEHNLRLVAHIAKKYHSPRRDADDLISTGTVGLIKAVSTFDRAKSPTLVSYASRCIENEILMSLRGERKTAGEISLSEPIGADGDGNEIALADILGSDADMVQSEAERSITAGLLSNAIESALSARERTVIKLRYGIPGGRCLAQREVAGGLGISRSYVSRIEKKALSKLREALRGLDK